MNQWNVAAGIEGFFEGCDVVQTELADMFQDSDHPLARYVRGSIGFHLRDAPHLHVGIDEAEVGHGPREKYTSQEAKWHLGGYVTGAAANVATCFLPQVGMIGVRTLGDVVSWIKDNNADITDQRELFKSYFD